jgi:hypothetical protein
VSYWEPLVVDGFAVDLSHLEPFEFEALPKGLENPATIHVTFNNHCFSEEFVPERHKSQLPRTHVSSHESRAFDHIRYNLSRTLPDYVRALGNARIGQTREGLLARIELAGGTDYGIFFTLKKPDKGPRRCELFVVTAFPLERPRHHVVVTGGMKFDVALALVLKGKKPKFPSGRY